MSKRARYRQMRKAWLDKHARGEDLFQIAARRESDKPKTERGPSSGLEVLAARLRLHLSAVSEKT